MFISLTEYLQNQDKKKLCIYFHRRKSIFTCIQKVKIPTNNL